MCICYTIFFGSVNPAVSNFYPHYFALGRYRLGVGNLVLTFWQNFFESVNKKKVYQFFRNMTKGGKLGLSPCCFLIHHNHDPLVWQPPTWSFHVPTMGNGLFQQQEWIGFLQTAFVTDSRIYLVMAFSQRACWMKTSWKRRLRFVKAKIFI